MSIQKIIDLCDAAGEHAHEVANKVTLINAHKTKVGFWGAGNSLSEIESPKAKIACEIFAEEVEQLQTDLHLELQQMRGPGAGSK